MNTKDKTKKELIKAFQDYIWKFWAGGDDKTPPCIKCGKPAVTLHEIIPRSLYPTWYEDINWNSVSVCDECHRWAETEGEAGRNKIRELTVQRLQQIREWNPDRVVRELDAETDV